jgi:hypothetical protein
MTRPQSQPVNTKKAATKFRKDAAAHASQLTRTKQSARKALVALGIYTASGKLSKHYS